MSQPPKQPTIFATMRSSSLGILVAAILSHTAACRPPSRPLSHVERGEIYESGSPTHDEYLSTVHELQTSVAAATIEERDVRMGLALQLRLLPTAESDQVLEHLEIAVIKLAKHQGRIEESQGGRRLRITPETEGSADPPTTELMRTAEEAGTGNLAISARLSDVPDRARRMKEIGRALLESVEKDFSAKPETRIQLSRELKASLVVLDGLSLEAEKISKRTRQFVDRVIKTLERGKHVEAQPTTKAQGAPPHKAPGKKTSKKPVSDFTP